MRKGRFSGYEDTSPEAVRPLGLAALLGFDFRRPDPADAPIVAERAGTFAAAVPVMAVSHLLWSLVVVHAAGPSLSLALPLAGVLLIDLALWLYDRRDPPPHQLARATAAAMICSGMLWAGAAMAT